MHLYLLLTNGKKISPNAKEKNTVLKEKNTERKKGKTVTHSFDCMVFVILN